MPPRELMRGLWLRSSAPMVGSGLQNFPGNSSKLQKVWKV